MLPQFYQSHLQQYLGRAQYLLLLLLVSVVQSTKQVRLEYLAANLPLPILFESRRRKLQHFLSSTQLGIDILWFPIVNQWLDRKWQPGHTLYIAIDRTQWGPVNILMLSIIYDRRAIPLYWQVLLKKGSSNLEEQQQALAAIWVLLKPYKVVILGDREFCSVRLANWLGEQGWYFCLRLRKNEFIQMKDELWVQLSQLGLAPGVSLYLDDIKVTKKHAISGFKLAAIWRRKYRGKAAKEGWFILTNLGSLSAARQAYGKRMGIEEMLRDHKKGGYNLEGTLLRGERLERLLLVIAIAYSSAIMNGEKIKAAGMQKYIGRVKEADRNYRRHSSFYIGLHGATWGQQVEPKIAELMNELLNLRSNKWHFYRRGLRAMSRVQSAF